MFDTPSAIPDAPPDPTPVPTAEAAAPPLGAPGAGSTTHTPAGFPRETEMGMEICGACHHIGKHHFTPEAHALTTDRLALTWPCDIPYCGCPGFKPSDSYSLAEPEL